MHTSPEKVFVCFPEFNVLHDQPCLYYYLYYILSSTFCICKFVNEFIKAEVGLFVCERICRFVNACQYASVFLFASVFIARLLHKRLQWRCEVWDVKCGM